MKKIILILFIVCPFLIFSQEGQKKIEFKRNTLYFEAFGQGMYNAFSYDRLYRIDKKIKTSITVGLTVIPSGELFVLATPVAYNFLLGQKSHHLEFGIGITPMYIREGKITVTRGYTDVNNVRQEENFIGHDNNYFVYVTPKLGYRFQKPEGGMFYRVTLTPPTSGISYWGPMKGGSNDALYKEFSHMQYFKSAAMWDGYKIFPWGGISIGWTIKNNKR